MFYANQTEFGLWHNTFAFFEVLCALIDFFLVRPLICHKAQRWLMLFLQSPILLFHHASQLVCSLWVFFNRLRKITDRSLPHLLLTHKEKVFESIYQTLLTSAEGGEKFIVQKSFDWSMQLDSLIDLEPFLTFRFFRLLFSYIPNRTTEKLISCCIL